MPAFGPARSAGSSALVRAAAGPGLNASAPSTPPRLGA